MTLAWTGTLADGTELSGTVRIPEVSHEVYDGLSEYVVGLSPPPTSSTTCSEPSSTSEANFSPLRCVQFDFSSPSTSSPSYISTKKILPPQLKELFSRFQNALIDVHGKDLLKSDEGAASPGSGASTPVVAAPSSSAAASSSSTSKSTTATPAGSKLNTSTVKVQGSFQASADDLWSLLTDERKVRAALSCVYSRSHTLSVKSNLILTVRFVRLLLALKRTPDPYLVSLLCPILTHPRRSLLPLLRRRSRQSPVRFGSQPAHHVLGSQELA
jgi:activator of HSP90 ATPase